MHQGAKSRARKIRRGRAPRVSVLYGAGLRPSLCPVSDSTSALEASQKGRSSLPAASHRASTNRGRAAPPRLCHTPRRKQAGKIRAPIGTPLVSFRCLAFDGCSTRLVVCVEVGCLLGIVVWMAWLLRCGCGDVGCSKITTGKEKRLSQSVAAQ